MKEDKVENFKKPIDPNKEYIIFEKEKYGEVNICNKKLIANSFLIGLISGLIIGGILFVLLLIWG